MTLKSLRNLFLTVITAAATTLAAVPPENAVWPRPVLVPVPTAVNGVRQPVVSLKGTWKVNTAPPADFWNNSSDPASWRDMAVPGQLSSQGINLQGPQIAYKTKIAIPADFAGKRIILKFQGVTAYAKVWVNGTYVRDHFGGFTAWTCDVTDHVTAGQDAWLTVGVTNRREGISSFNDGSILRDVKLMAVPQNHLIRFNIETTLDSNYRNAVLKVWTAMAVRQGAGGRVNLTLRDAEGRTIALNPSSVELTGSNPETILEIPVASPRKWDAEHPNLYTLQASVTDGAAVVETVSRTFGFRQIQRVGRRLLVNGKEVKLRGVDRHDIDPLTGRAVAPEQCDRDAQIFRAANMNFIRTSHYPPMEEFLDACDRYGLYVDDEASVAFAVNGVQNDPGYTPDFMNQWSEQIERDRSHPSVLMWSMGNESAWGRNIRKQYDYAKVEDPSRPIIFSWADLAPFGAQPPFEIYSLHYAYYDSDTSAFSDLWSGTWWNPGYAKNFSLAGQKQTQTDVPVMHDESTHIPAYDLNEQMRDPGVRNFWGETIKRFWENIFPTEGALGAGIWAGIDDTMIDPRLGVARGREWGVIDGWRRQKPEYWLAKKAYSPVRVDDKPLLNVAHGAPIRVPVKNWFDHTNFSELAIRWTLGAGSGTASLDLEPHQAGTLTIPARDWKDGDVLNLKFYRLGDLLVDEFNLPLNPQPRTLAPPQGPAPALQEAQDRIVISGQDFNVAFSRQTGLITSGSYKGTEIIKSGPYLHLEGVRLADWSLKQVAARREANEAVVNISGSYGPVQVTFEVRIDGQGLMITHYKLDSLPIAPPLPKVWVTLSSDVGGYREVGVSFVLTGAVDRLAWQRKGLWSAYPDDHIGRNSGIANREGKGAGARVGVLPGWPWSQDERNFVLYGKYDLGGRGTNDFRSMKENIWYASAVVAGTENRVRAESDGKEAVRLQVLDDPASLVDDRDPRVKLVGAWMPIDDDARSYKGTESYSKQAGDSAEFAFQGTGVAWIGSKERFHGHADVYLDNKLEAAGVDLNSGPTGDMSEGWDKQPRVVLFSKEGLPDGPHTIKVVVKGEKSPASGNSWVSVDAFQVLGSKTKPDVSFIISNQWNYPEVGWLRWGNYAKDAVIVTTGYANQVRLRFADHDTAR
jgi:hypothetical protein